MSAGPPPVHPSARRGRRALRLVRPDRSSPEVLADELPRVADRRVGIVTTYVDRWYFATILAGAERVLHEAGIEVVVHQVGSDWTHHSLLTSDPASLGLDAIITVAVPIGPRQVQRWETSRIPVVVAGARVSGAECVVVDDVRGGLLATDHLLELGHRRIGMVRTCDESGRVWPADRNRTAGYREALRRAGIGLDESLVQTVPFHPRHAARAARDLLGLADPPTAVFVHCDELAFGCLQTFGELGLDVPGAVSVVGFDDHPLAEVMGLTTVDQQVETQGELAARLTLDALVEVSPRGRTGASTGSRAEVHELPVSLVRRRTTAPLGSRG